MKQFRSILCCVNDPGQSDPALHRAVALAKSNGARLTLADADHTGLHFWQSESVQREIERRRAEQLDEFARQLREPGLDVSATVLTGHPAASIIQEVNDVGHDLVLKTSRAEGLATRLFFGETSIRLMRRCPCPVWILQPPHSKFRRILAAIDPSAKDSAHAELNRQIMEAAASVADVEQCELHLSYVIPEFQDSVLLPPEYSEQLDDLRRETIAAAKLGIAELFNETGIRLSDQRVHRLTGNPGEAVSEFANSHDIDLIVLGAITRSTFDGFMIGNTAEKVMHSVGCSVLTVKPSRVAITAES